MKNSHEFYAEFHWLEIGIKQVIETNDSSNSFIPTSLNSWVNFFPFGFFFCGVFIASTRMDVALSRAFSVE